MGEAHTAPVTAEHRARPAESLREGVLASPRCSPDRRWIHWLGARLAGQQEGIVAHEDKARTRRASSSCCASCRMWSP